VVLGVAVGVVAGLFEGVVLGVFEGVVLGVFGGVVVVAGGVDVAVAGGVGVPVAGVLVVGVPVVGVLVLEVVVGGVLVCAGVGAVVGEVVVWWGVGVVGSVDGAAQGGVVLGDAVDGRSGLPTGRDGRVLDREGAWDRSTGCSVGVLGGGWVLAVSCERDGTNSQVPRIARPTAASTPSFSSGRRRRLCRAPNLRACRPSWNRWNCLTKKPFTPRP
jgi:hypothetical protein